MTIIHQRKLIPVNTFKVILTEQKKTVFFFFLKEELPPVLSDCGGMATWAVSLMLLLPVGYFSTEVGGSTFLL